MRVAAEHLTWHDGAVFVSQYDAVTRRLIWQVEVFRWDIGERGDAVGGDVEFVDVVRMEAFHDVAVAPSPESCFWDVLDATFERVDGMLQCRFLLALPHVVNALGGSGYGEMIVVCRDAWYTPSP